jgi:RNase P subunit RPR2
MAQADVKKVVPEPPVEGVASIQFKFLIEGLQRAPPRVARSFARALAERALTQRINLSEEVRSLFCNGCYLVFREPGQQIVRVRGTRKRKQGMNEKEVTCGVSKRAHLMVSARSELQKKTPLQLHLQCAECGAVCVKNIEQPLSAKPVLKPSTPVPSTPATPRTPTAVPKPSTPQLAQSVSKPLAAPKAVATASTPGPGARGAAPAPAGGAMAAKTPTPKKAGFSLADFISSL